MRTVAVVGLSLGLVLLPGCGTRTDDASSPDRVTSVTPSASSSTGTGAATAQAPGPASTTSSSGASTDAEGAGGAGYCEALIALIGLERPDEGTGDHDDERRYRTLLQAVHDESPPEHKPTWDLFSILADEPFSYDNFNPAVDSLEQIGAELSAGCPGAESVLVDEDGRLISWSTAGS